MVLLHVLTIGELLRLRLCTVAYTIHRLYKLLYVVSTRYEIAIDSRHTQRKLNEERRKEMCVFVCVCVRVCVRVYI